MITKKLILLGNLNMRCQEIQKSLEFGGGPSPPPCVSTRLNVDQVIPAYIQLFCTDIRPLLLTGDLKRIRINYYRYCKFLLYLPRSYRNTKLIKKYCATDITGVFEKLSPQLAIEAPYRLGCFHRLIHLFKQFVVTNCSKKRPSSIVNETLKNGY